MEAERRELWRQTAEMWALVAGSNGSCETWVLETNSKNVQLWWQTAMKAERGEPNAN